MDEKPPQTPLNLPQQAINAALNCSFEEALKLNRQILRADPKNVDALARFARACFELGKFDLAKKYYNQVLKIDSYNPIALKNLKILKSAKNGHAKATLHHQRVTPNMFLHEPGKTKVVTLLKVAEPQRLSNLYPGMPVTLVSKNRGLSVLDSTNLYLGILPDDTAFLLIKLMKGGNRYEAFIRSVRVNGLSIMIRESFRAARFKNRPSFVDNGFKFQNIGHVTPILEGPMEIIEDEEE